MSTQPSKCSCIGWKRAAPCAEELRGVTGLATGHVQPSVFVHEQQPCHATSRSPPQSDEICIKAQHHRFSYSLQPPAARSVLQICYKNHFIQRRYAELSRVESGSCSTHSLTETLLTIRICFAIVTAMLTVKMSEIFICF